jgi:outer membrane immunogenic protein
MARSIIAAPRSACRWGTGSRSTLSCSAQKPILAWGALSATILDGATSTPQLALGWVLGGGVEVALDEYWSLRAEYQHIELGNVETAIYANGGGGYIHRANAPALDLLRVGANYRF